MLFNLAWSFSWSAILHPQCAGLAVGWNLAWPQVPSVCRLKTLVDAGSKWHNKWLLDPVTTAEHPRGSLWLRSKNKNISGDFKDKRSQKFPCTKSPGEGKTHISLALLTSRFAGRGSGTFSCRRWKELRRTEVWNNFSLCLKGRERERLFILISIQVVSIYT